MNLHRAFQFAILTVSLTSACSETALAQLIRAPLNEGFVRTSSIAMTVDEMLASQKERSDENQPIVGPGYPDLKIAEVQFKPVRYLRMQVTDPKTGTTAPELVWYMIWRAIPRDYTDLAGDSKADLLKKLSDPELNPANAVDQAAHSAILLPRFVLTTDDSGPKQSYVDEVNLQIQQAVFSREYGDSAANLKILNSVEAITEFGEPAASDDPDPLAKAVYGVAVWRNVDSETDYFTVEMSGFCNAYQIVNDGGEPVFHRKVIEQKFGRPGDRFAANEKEFRVLGNPSWVYRPFEADVNVPDFQAILRKTRVNNAQAAD